MVQIIISWANNEEKMVDISARMCLALKDAPNLFAHRQYNVTNTKLRKDIHFEEAALTAVSCHGTNDYFISRYGV